MVPRGGLVSRESHGERVTNSANIHRGDEAPPRLEAYGLSAKGSEIAWNRGGQYHNDPMGKNVSRSDLRMDRPDHKHRPGKHGVVQAVSLVASPRLPLQSFSAERLSAGTRMMSNANAHNINE